VVARLVPHALALARGHPYGLVSALSLPMSAIGVYYILQSLSLNASHMSHTRREATLYESSTTAVCRPLGFLTFTACTYE